LSPTKPDAAAWAKCEHDKAGTDHQAFARRDAQAGADPNPDPYATANRHKLTDRTSPANQGVLVGCCGSVARMLDEVATVPGVRGVMLTCDDFVIGMEQFGQRIEPLMESRARALAA
jgi:pyrimidine oxygenase